MEEKTQAALMRAASQLESAVREQEAALDHLLSGGSI